MKETPESLGKSTTVNDGKNRSIVFLSGAIRPRPSIHGRRRKREGTAIFPFSVKKQNKKKRDRAPKLMADIRHPEKTVNQKFCLEVRWGEAHFRKSPQVTKTPREKAGKKRGLRQGVCSWGKIGVVKMIGFVRQGRGETEEKARFPKRERKSPQKKKTKKKGKGSRKGGRR